MLEGPAPRTLSNYWSDCKRLRAPGVTPRDFEIYRETVLPLRLKATTSPKLTNRFLDLAGTRQAA